MVSVTTIWGNREQRCYNLSTPWCCDVEGLHSTYRLSPCLINYFNKHCWVPQITRHSAWFLEYNNANTHFLNVHHIQVTINGTSIVTIKFTLESDLFSTGTWVWTHICDQCLRKNFQQKKSQSHRMLELYQPSENNLVHLLIIRMRKQIPREMKWLAQRYVTIKHL